jgi:hypothetical protein
MQTIRKKILKSKRSNAAGGVSEGGISGWSKNTKTPLKMALASAYPEDHGTKVIRDTLN